MFCYDWKPEKSNLIDGDHENGEDCSSAMIVELEMLYGQQPMPFPVFPLQIHGWKYRLRHRHI